MALSLAEAQAQLDDMLRNLGISKAQYQGRSFEFPVGANRLVEIAKLEAIIRQQTDQQAGGSTSRSTFARFNRG